MNVCVIASAIMRESHISMTVKKLKRIKENTSFP